MLPVSVRHSKLHSTPSSVAIIVPTLDERHSLPETVAAVRAMEGDAELLFVDGGSTDGTVEWLRAEGLAVLSATRGRGSQLAEGARAASAPILWFLHADCRLPPGGIRAVLEAVDRGAVAGVCSLRFRGNGGPARAMTWLYPRLARLGLVYGDAALFVRRDAYEAVGGFREWPLFEDLDLMDRLRRLYPSGVQRIGATVEASSRRFAHGFFPLILLQWVVLQILFWLGVPPRVLARLYRPTRGA